MKVDDNIIYVKARGIPRKDRHLGCSASHIYTENNYERLSMNTPTKKCTKCNEDKPTSEYTKQSSSEDGLYHSCRGCKNKAQRHSKNIRPPEYRVWHSIISRCTCPTATNYYAYGARGITMSDKWRHSFDTFYLDMGSRPSPNHEIDRIDSNGNYEPSNCRWVTHTENSRNKRNTKLTMQEAESIRYQVNFGRVLGKELASEFGVTQTTVHDIANNKIWKKEEV